MKKPEKIYEHLDYDLAHVNLDAALFSDSDWLCAMSEMFPRDGHGHRSPIQTDSYSLAIRNIPEELKRFISENIVQDWLQILGDSEMHYVPDPDTYHISVAIPQDVAAASVERQRVLKPHSWAMRNDELIKVAEEIVEIVEIVEDKDKITLRPIGARAGGDGALAFVFEFDKLFYKKRKDVIRKTTEHTKRRYTGIVNPMVSLTICRTLENPTVTPRMKQSLETFRENYSDVRRRIKEQGLQDAVRIDTLVFCHEKQWLATELGFCYTLKIGEKNLQFPKELRSYLSQLH